MTLSNRRPLAILHMQKIRKLGNFIEKMRAIVLDITNNAVIFVTPSPALATVTTNLDNLETAETLAKTKVPGSVADRNIKYNICLADARDLLAYVQGIADNASNEDGAIMIIAASGFDLKHHGVHVRPDFTVRNTGVSGKVELTAKVKAKREANEWQMSDDRTIWVSIPATLEATTFVTGLTPGASKYFRHRAVLKGQNPQGWSQIVSIVVT